MVTVYTTIPILGKREPGEYRERLVREARWAEAAGMDGTLVVSDNASLDPWAVAQYLIERTERFVPLVAVNAAYVHPLATARMIASLGFLYGRPVHLNYVNGGFQRHLEQLGGELDHDKRYDQLAEFVEIVSRLLAGGRPVTYSGAHYRVEKASVSPRLATGLLPRAYLSGTSDPCRAAADRLGVPRVAPPREIEAHAADPARAHRGLRLGILARDTSAEAWRVARKRFPVDDVGEKVHDFSARTVRSAWHQQLSGDALQSTEPIGAYWLYPFRSYQTLWPLLVGSHPEVGELLGRYLATGADTLVLDQPYDEEDPWHAMKALDIACQVSPERSSDLA
jgi:alkanesulfonate monooxygenase